MNQETIHPLGEDALGQLIYDNCGQMSVMIMQRQRIPFTSDLRREATAQECERAFREYLSYYGSFTIHVEAGTVIHHVVGSSFPNWIGKDLVRGYQIEGQTLRLTALNIINGKRTEAFWVRL